MSFGIANFDTLPQNIKLAFEDLEAYVNTFLLREHNPDGTHATRDTSPWVNSAGGVSAGAAGTTGGGRRWTGAGLPWTLDDPTAALPHVVGLRADPPAGTYHNYAPQNIDGAVMLELEPSGAVILTGIKVADVTQKRLLAIRNRDSANTLTLKHANTGSLGPYRFDLPDSEDLILGPRQIAWMYYDPGRQAWALFVTPQQSGGLATMSGDMVVVRVSLTNAQIQSMNTTPITIVAAPGAGKYIVIIGCAVIKETTAGAYSATPNWSLRWSGVATELTTPKSLGLNAANKTWERIGIQATDVGDTTDVTNLAVVSRLTADVTGGDAANYVVVKVAYFVMDDN